MHVVASLCVGHVDDTAVQQTQEVDSHFSVGNAVVFLRDDRSIEDNFAADKVELVVSEVEEALRFVPGHHTLSVSTKSGRVKGCVLCEA